MSDLHIDDFFHDAAKAIASLYTMFPRPITLYAEDIGGADEPDEYGVHSARYQACFATLIWLSEQGFIYYADTIRQDAVDQAVLTGRCFTTLLSTSPIADQNSQPDLPPSVARHQATQIYQLQQALKSKSSERVREAFQPLLEKICS
jgi:hypothetical protein